MQTELINKITNEQKDQALEEKKKLKKLPDNCSKCRGDRTGC